jgi:hypothetical protein
LAQSPYSQTATEEEATVVEGVAGAEEGVDHIMERAAGEEVDATTTEDTTKGEAAEAPLLLPFDILGNRCQRQSRRG